jgi:hypothetical protein
MTDPVVYWPQWPQWLKECICGADDCCDLRPVACCNKFVVVRKKWPKACSGYHDHVKPAVGASKKT